MARTEVSKEWRLVYAGVVLVVAALLLWSVQSVLSPVPLFLLLLLLLVPYTGTDRHVLLVTGASLLILVWMLAALGGLLAPFILAFVVAYILDPAVDRLERRGVPRGVSVALLGLPVLALLALAVIFGVPALLAQLDALLARIPEGVARFTAWADGLDERAVGSRLPRPLAAAVQELAARLTPEAAALFIQDRQAVIGRIALEGVLGVGRGVGIVLSIIGYVVLTPVLIVYLLRDFDGVTKHARALIPASRQETWLRFLNEYDGLLSRYLRGQVVAATIVGVLTWLGLWAAGFPYPGVVGAVAGVFNLVPYLGLVVSAVPAVIIAALSGAFLANLLKAAVVFGVVQLIDGTVTGPRIVGESVGLHPVWVLLALAVGGFFFGFVGLLIAMPAAVLIKLLVRDGLVRWRQSAVYRGEEGSAP